MKKILLLIPVSLLLFACSQTPVDLSKIERVDGNTVVKGEDDAYSGQVVMFYENGQTQFVENVKEGKKHGVYEGYYKTGLKKTQGRYENGKRKGVWKWWNEKGEVYYQVDYSSSASFRF
ncbi:MAG: hypothetical protein ABIJ16_00090 [Bacteroidota bacterium]